MNKIMWKRDDFRVHFEVNLVLVFISYVQYIFVMRVNKINLEIISGVFLIILLISCNDIVTSVKGNTGVRKGALYELSNSIFQSKRDTFKLKAYMNESDSMDYKKGVAQAVDLLGVNYRNSSLYENAIKCHKQALEISEELNDTIQLLFALNNLGTVYRRVDDFPSSTDCYLKVLSYIDCYSKKDRRSYKSKAIALNGLGNINLSQSEYEKALVQFKRALNAEKALKSWRGMAIDYLCLGSTYVKLNKTDSALLCYQKSLKLNVNNNSKVGQTICNSDLGNVYYQKGDFSESLILYKRSLEMSKRTKDPYYIAMCNVGVGRVYFAMKKYKKAITYLKEGYNKAKSINSRSEIANSAFLISELYDKLGNLNKAFKYYKIAQNVQNEIYNTKKTEHVAILNARFNVAVNQRIIKDKDNALAVTESRLRMNKIMIFSIVIILAILLIFFFFIIKESREKQNTKRIKLEQKLLRSQMNPHFIFNSLGAIQNFMYKNDTRSAAKYLGNFASLMRFVLDNSREDMISFDQEINTLKHYLELEKLRMNNGFKYKINISNDIESEFEYLPPMLLQPFLENAIIHGLKNITYEGYIELKVTKDELNYVFEICDNGVGYHPEEFKSNGHKSYGLKIFLERINNIYGMNKVGLDIKKVDDDGVTGTVVMFKLPIMN